MEEFPSPIYLIYGISLCVSVALSLETFGVFGRYWGSLNEKNAQGYSFHVRTATLGRFLTFASAPTYGLIVDSGADANIFILAGFMIFTLVAFQSLVIMVLPLNHKLLVFDSISKVKRGGIVKNTPSYLNRDVSWRIIILSSLSFSVTASGLLVANYLAACFPESRAFFVQLTSIITATGTLLHVFFVDPLLSRMCDLSHQTGLSGSISYVIGRGLASLTLTIFFAVFYLYG